MQRTATLRSASYIALCSSPWLIAVLVGIRSLRIPVVHELVGGLLFAGMALCAWWLSRAVSGSAAKGDSRIRLAGMLLLVPFALMGLLWVGLGTPWDATPPENELRYAVLLSASIAITAAFLLLSEALCDAGERLCSKLGLAASLLSGAAFVVWNSFQLGYFAMLVAQGQVSAAMTAMNNVFDALLFAAGALAYAATAAFASSMGKLGWLGRWASLAYVLLNILALTFLMLRGVSFPIPAASPEPWYTRPGFIVGVPAIPWIMPFLLGVVLLRRPGNQRP